MERDKGRPSFDLGQIVITPNAMNQLDDDAVIEGLRRHAVSDWGDLCEEDREANNRALYEGTRLLSAYKSKAGLKYWIITEADRSATTILLPEDY